METEQKYCITSALDAFIGDENISDEIVGAMIRALRKGAMPSVMTANPLCLHASAFRLLLKEQQKCVDRRETRNAKKAIIMAKRRETEREKRK